MVLGETIDDRHLPDFVESIRGVGDQLTEKDFLVAVEGVDDQAHELSDLGLESEGFHILSHCVDGLCKCSVRIQTWVKRVSFVVFNATTCVSNGDEIGNAGLASRGQSFVIRRSF